MYFGFVFVFVFLFVFEELVQTRPEDPKYVDLTILENKHLKAQLAISSHLVLLKNEERDLFTQLAIAIKDYHDSQSINAQKYKYLSIISSAVLAVISIIGATVYNNNTMKLITTTEQNLKDNSNRKHVEILSRLPQKRGASDSGTEENSGYGVMKTLSYVEWGIGS